MVTGRTQPAPLRAGSVTLFWVGQALYPAAQPRISSLRSLVGPAWAGVASSFSTVPDSRTPLKYRSLERFFVAEESEKSGAASAQNQRERSPATVTNPSARTQTWSAARAQPVPWPSRA